MRRLSCRGLFLSSLPLMVAWSLCPAFGQETGAESTWKIVAAPDSSDETAAPRDTAPTWDDRLAPAPAPIPQPVVQPPLPPAVQPAPPLPPRPFIPSRQLAAVNRGERPSTPLTEEQVRAALGYQPNGLPNQPVAQMPRRTSIAPSLQAPRRQGKPFQTMTRDPTINPWLFLDREENYIELPNYYTFVRPQMDQLDTNRRNQYDILQLRRDVQNVSTPAVGPQYGATPLPGTGHTARFMDTAQFYGRWQR